jgi:hypothetical protein
VSEELDPARVPEWSASAGQGQKGFFSKGDDRRNPSSRVAEADRAAFQATVQKCNHLFANPSFLITIARHVTVTLRCDCHHSVTVIIQKNQK